MNGLAYKRRESKKKKREREGNLFPRGAWEPWKLKIIVS